MKVKYNFLYAFVLSIAFISIDIIFRYLHKDNLILFTSLKDYIAIYLFFLLISFFTDKILKIVLYYITFIFIIQIIHFNYFGYFIFPMEIILFFQKFKEINESLLSDYNIFIIPIIFTTTLLATIKLGNKLFLKKRIIAQKLMFFSIFVFILVLFNNFYHYKKLAMGEKPDTNLSIIRNSLYMTKTFLGKFLPMYIFDLHVVNNYVSKIKFKKNNLSSQNVILIIGESLTLYGMSLYGYNVNTTPNLIKLSNEKNFYFTKCISAGVFTDTSIPMILNIAYKANAIKHIILAKTNIFKLAKDNNYSTYWISAQPNDGFSYIRSYMGLKYIDHYIDSMKYTNNKNKGRLDDILLEEIKNINLNDNKHFIVLNMIGSHSPYNIRVPKNFKPFGNKNILQHYQNTVAYTDKIILDIIKYLKENVKTKTILFFTSDHGQKVTLNSGIGHGNINNVMHFQVPLIVYTFNFNLYDNKKIASILKKFKKQYISHYDMGLLIAYYLGYDGLTYLDYNKAYINGNELSGNGGVRIFDLNSSGD